MCFEGHVSFSSCDLKTNPRSTDILVNMCGIGAYIVERKEQPSERVRTGGCAYTRSANGTQTHAGSMARLNTSRVVKGPSRQRPLPILLILLRRPCPFTLLSLYDEEKGLRRGRGSGVDDVPSSLLGC